MVQNRHLGSREALLLLQFLKLFRAGLKVSKDK